MTAASARRGALFLLALLPVLLCGCGGDGAEPVADGDAAAAGATPSAGTEPGAGEAAAGREASAEPLAREAVSVYFPSASGDGLVAERREIFATRTPGDRIKQIINDLIDGPASSGSLRALPAGTQLRQVFVVEDGTAYLDFNAELADGMRGGSAHELYTVYAIVNSVILNVNGVRRVGLLVNGHPVDSLSGHLDLRRPLTADRSLVLGKSA